ncbi:carboxymuconolactone decarboxylase family protein [Henriciella litoralis]|uniref:carboxymuconolactone decarboxylase family protein n=1 Tax=Henriciella litoralis TaxID=568102 RepID=UPI000A0347D4|nr:carboxymuconolactone decarboxylase family protein [Henriciella litoralis]
MRLRRLDRAALSERQREVAESIAATRSGGLAGPFAAWLHAPVAANLAEKLGAHLRYGTSLPAQVTESVILAVAASCNCALERQIHEPIARRSGVPEDLIRTLVSKDMLECEGPMSTAALAARQIVEGNKLSDETYKACVEEFGEAGTVELILVAGYYVLVALTINAFEVGIEDTV